MRNKSWIKFGSKESAGVIWDVERTDEHEDQWHINLKMTGKTDTWGIQDAEDVLIKVLLPIHERRSRPVRLRSWAGENRRRDESQGWCISVMDSRKCAFVILRKERLMVGLPMGQR